MIHRSVSPSEVRGVPDGARHILLGERNRLVKRAPERQLAGDGRGKRAAGSMRVPAGDPFGVELDETVAVVQQVADVSGLDMASLDDHVRSAQCHDSPRRLPPILVGPNRHP